jgi:hypothetical protein
MKRYYQLPAIAIFFFYFSSNAQVFRKKIIHAGESVSDASYYLFPSFAYAAVKLKSGTLNSKMNFNLLLCQMQFINVDNDTLVISSPENIDSIQLNNNVFFFNNGYYQVLGSSDSVKLAVLRKVSYVPIKIGALGLPNYSGTGEQTYTSVVATVGEKKLIMSEDVEVTSETDYLLITNGTQFNKVNKEAFIKAFPQQEEKLRSYFKQYRVNFNKEGDLKKLFQFCSGTD